MIDTHIITNKKHVYDTYMTDQDMYDTYIDTHIHMIDIQTHIHMIDIQIHTYMIDIQIHTYT